MISFPALCSSLRACSVPSEPPGFWVNPCGFPVPPSNTQPPPDSSLAGTYHLQLQQTLQYLNQWKEEFTQSKFRVPFSTAYEWDDSTHYDWLRVESTIPKRAGEQLEGSHYADQDFDQMLAHSSDILQRCGVGWEQVDLEKTDEDFIPQFKSTVDQLRIALCALDHVLASKGMEEAPDPTRSIMPDYLRNPVYDSERDLRTFRILKDYVNALEYFVDGFGYFSTTYKTCRIKSSL